MIRWHYFVSYSIPVAGGLCEGQANIDTNYRFFKDGDKACRALARSVKGATSEFVVVRFIKLTGIQFGPWKVIWG